MPGVVPTPFQSWPELASDSLQHVRSQPATPNMSREPVGVSFTEVHCIPLSGRGALFFGAISMTPISVSRLHSIGKSRRCFCLADWRSMVFVPHAIDRLLGHNSFNLELPCQYPDPSNRSVPWPSMHSKAHACNLAQCIQPDARGSTVARFFSGNAHVRTPTCDIMLAAVGL